MVLFSMGPDIRQVKSCIRRDTGYHKMPDYPTGYPVLPYLILKYKRYSLVEV
jgi:hypothetical protein